MVKSRFSSLDVRAMVNSVRPEAVGCKLTNIYDINSKVYILKLARTGFKCFLLLESGTRFHLTNYSRDKSSTPSNYTMKLRKHIRTRRLTSIQQIGSDRSVDFTFGRGEYSFHLILELYVSGNLILTDHEYRIVAVLRTHTDEKLGSKIAVREIYPLELATGLLVAPLAELGGKIEAILAKAAERQMNQEDQEQDKEDETAFKAKNKSDSAYPYQKRSKKRVDHSAIPLVTMLHKLAAWADPQLCAHVVGKALKQYGHEFNNAFKVTADDLDADENITVLTRAAELALDVLRSVSRPDDLGGGHIAALTEVAEGQGEEQEEDDDDDEEGAPAEEAKASNTTGAIEQGGVPQEALAPIVPGWILRKRLHVPPADAYWVNDEFLPLQPEAGADPEASVSFPSFHVCVDEFYSKLEEYKVEESKAQHAQNVYAKVDRIRDCNNTRIQVMEAEQDASDRQASLIEANVELVERALLMLNTMVASQVDWGELWREVKKQQRLGHPIAQHIQSLDLEHNAFKMILGQQPDDEDFDLEDDSPMEVVPLDLSLTAHANVARLHSKRKETREKTSKTVVASVSAVKQAERRAQQDLKKFELKQTLRRVRQTWWFEKFVWFISSENYIVIAGHDATQTEQIFCRLLGPQDIFVQADVQGARTFFIKNPSGGEVPPATLREAGTMVLCHSAAWDRNLRISAWWALCDQVVKPGKDVAPDSDSVAVDGFLIRGHRRPTPPLHLEMGFTLLFHVADSCAERHRAERKSRYLEAMGGEGVDAGQDDTQDSGDDAEGAAVEMEPDSDVETPSVEDAAAQVVSASDSRTDGLDVAGGGAVRADEPEAALECDEEDDEAEAEGPAEVVQEAGQPASPTATAEDDTISDLASSTGGRVSKAERRRMKKGGGAGDEPPQPQAPTPAVAAPAPAKAVPKAPAVLLRGQKAKAKKIKDKYAEQDDDERELRLALLGSKASKVASIGSVQSAAPDVAEEDVSEAPPAASSDAAATAKGRGKSDAAAAKGSGKGAGGAKGNKRGPQGNATNEVLRPGCEHDAAMDLQLAQLDLLTGQPSAEDEVLYAMPMVAPYCALGGPYSFRVKLTHGPSKKGQAAKTCLRMLQSQLEKPAWKTLVQAIPEQDAAGMLCGTCKLSMPGMQKLTAQMNREKKKEKQAQESEKPAKKK